MLQSSAPQRTPSLEGMVRDPYPIYAALRETGPVVWSDEARGGGWVARAERLADEAGECAAAGFVLTPRFLGALSEGDTETAKALATDMVDRARRLCHVHAGTLRARPHGL